MLRPAIKFRPFSRATSCLLDIARGGLGLQHGKRHISRPWPTPLKPGLPELSQMDEVRAIIADAFAELEPLKSPIEITLSDALTRSFILQRLPGLASIQEIEALARDQMMHLYGDNDSLSNGAQWAIQVDALPFSRQWPVIAIPQMLIDVLTEASQVLGCAISKIQPRFVHALNAQKGSSGWRVFPFGRSRHQVLCLETDESLTLGLRSSGQWKSLRTNPPLAMNGVDLPSMIQRECRSLGIAPEDCRIQTLETHSWSSEERAQ